MENPNISDRPERKRMLLEKELIYRYVFDKYKDEKIAVAKRIAEECNISLLQAQRLVIRMNEEKKEG